MKFFESVGWWLPADETHLQAWMLQVNAELDGRLTYQRHKYLAALPYVRGRGVAVDVGAHVGLWSWQMAKDFERVVAFEPMPNHGRCWDLNMREVGNAVLFDYALGETAGTAWLKTRTKGSSGDTGIEPGAEHGDVKAHVCRIDSLALREVHLIKMDCEGYELFVCRGATETLLRCKPVVIVEQKPETGMAARYGVGTTDAVKFLESLGAKRKEAIQGDYIMAWD